MRKVVKDINIYEWHKWFAWYPIKIDPENKGNVHTKIRVFWEYVERRWMVDRSDHIPQTRWEYRFIK